MTSSEDPGETVPQSDQGLHCFVRYVCPDT